MNPEKHQDEELDETVAQSSPASDPPANTVETGIRLIAEPGPVRDNREANRFELIAAGELAFLAYEENRTQWYSFTQRCRRLCAVSTLLTLWSGQGWQRPAPRDCASWQCAPLFART